MHALRVGLKRIDSKRTRGERGKRASIEGSNDLSACPIIGFQDSNIPYPANDEPIAWEPFQFHSNAQQLSDEASVSTIRTQARSQYGEHEESTQLLTKSGSHSASQRINPRNWKPLVAFEYDENIRPIASKEKGREVGFSKWESFARHSEAMEPFLREQLTASSRAILVEKQLSPVRNPSRWQPIEHDESTKPVSGRRNFDAGDTQITQDLRKHNNRSRVSKNFNQPVSQPLNKATQMPSAIFDPFSIADDNDRTEPSSDGQKGYVFNRNPKDSAPYSTRPTSNNRDQGLYQKNISYQHPKSGFERYERGYSQEFVEPDIFPLPYSSAENECEREVIVCDEYPEQDDEVFQQSEHFHGSRGAPESDEEYLEGDFVSEQDNEFEDEKAPEVQCDEHSEQDGEVYQQSEHFHGSSVAPEYDEEYLEGDFVSEQDNEWHDENAAEVHQGFRGNAEYTDMKSSDQDHGLDESYLESPAPDNYIQFDRSGNEFCEQQSHLNDKGGDRTETYWEHLQLEPEMQGEFSSTTTTAVKDHRDDLDTVTEHMSSFVLREDETSIQNGDVTNRNHPTVTEKDETGGLRLIVLLSEFSGTLRQRTRQERAMAILRGRKIKNIVEVDGSATCSRDRRDELFGISSGESLEYPQFFLQRNQGTIIHLGDFEWLTYMNDIGSLNNDTIFGASNPSSSHIETVETEQEDTMNGEVDADTKKQKPQFIDVEAIESTKFVQDPYCNEVTQSENIFVHDIHEQNYLTRSTQPTVDDGDESLCSTGTRLQVRPSNESPVNRSQMIIGEHSKKEIELSESKPVRRKGRRTLIATTGSLLDDEDESGRMIPSSDSCNSSINSDAMSRDDLGSLHSKLPTYENPDQGKRDGENGNNSLSIEVGFHRKNAIDTCSSFDKPEPPKVRRDTEEDQMPEEIDESQEKRRKRWKRRIIAEHLRRKAMKEKPLGASVDEIEMINTFMSIAGPIPDGPLSVDALEELQGRLREAGLPVEFTNKMLEQRKQKSNGAQQLETVSSIDPALAADEDTYDEKGFTRKTPKEHPAFVCFQSAFLADSVSIVGADMMENAQAALNTDNENKKGWSSTNMIESVKASLSGDSESKSGWPAVNMIESIKASLSGDSTERKSGWDVIGSVKASFSADSNDSAGWRSNNVFASIKNALSGDSESRRGTRSIDQTIDKAATSNNGGNKGGQSAVIVESVEEDDNTLNEEGLHEC